MALTKIQRKLLSELAELANKFGSPLDYTATSYIKLRDIQKSYMLTWKVIYGAICDDPENEFREVDLKDAHASLKKLKELSNVVYPDRQGNI